jgi:hypothetical protein
MYILFYFADCFGQLDLELSKRMAPNRHQPTRLVRYCKYTLLNSNIDLFDIIKYVTTYLAFTNRWTSLLFGHIKDGSKMAGFFNNPITSRILLMILGCTCFRVMRIIRVLRLDLGICSRIRPQYARWSISWWDIVTPKNSKFWNVTKIL